MGDFKELRVWKISKELAKDIYKETMNGSFSRDFGLRDQIRRAAVSVPSNIAEGDELNTQKQGIRHLYIAKGSLAELRTQLEISYEIDYISEELYNQYETRCIELGKMLTSLIKHRANN